MTAQLDTHIAAAPSRPRLCTTPRPSAGRVLHSELHEGIRESVTASKTSLTDIVGIGAVLAATFIGHAGDITRFADRGHFASYVGVAPIEASSGDVRCHRLSRRGNRRLNAAIHMAALGQISHPSSAGTTTTAARRGQDSPGSAPCTLKRQLAKVIFRHLLADADAEGPASAA